ncbi:hypothetical protein ACLOJK_034418, partial [Asimina triloba]
KKPKKGGWRFMDPVPTKFVITRTDLRGQLGQGQAPFKLTLTDVNEMGRILLPR